MLDRLLDATVLFSFDGTGYRRHARAWTDPAPDLRGQRVAVTGANQGLGRAAARQLGAWGAEVWMVCRSRERGTQARDELRAELGDRFHLALADTGRLADVRALPAALPERLDALVHNAGALLDAREETPEGLERTFATHVAGPFLLSHLLRERLAGGRLVWVSSGGMYAQRLRVDDLQSRRGYDGVVAYARMKRAQVVLAEQLAARWPEVWVASMHPGWADTQGVRQALPTFRRLLRATLRTAEEGADTVAWLAAAPRGPSGRFWFDRREAPTHLLPGTRESDADRQALWDAVVAATGVQPPAGGRASTTVST